MRNTHTLAAFLGAYALSGFAASGCVTAAEPVTSTAAKIADAAAKSPAPNSFLVQDGDTWVMVGDSITWQKLYTTYLEAFIRARYPQLKFAVVNSGKSGEVTIQGMIRFRGTIAAYKPTLVSSAYGMNDHTKTYPGEQDFLEVPNSPAQRFAGLVKAAGARYVVISSSPMLAPADYSTDGGVYQLPPVGKTPPSGWRSNPVGRQFADKMQQLATRNGAPYLDQMAPLQEVWAANFGMDSLAVLRQRLAPVLEVQVTAENETERARALTTVLKPFLGNPEAVQMLPLPDKDVFLARYLQLKTLRGAELEAYRLYLLNWVASLKALNPPIVQVSGYTGSSRASDLIHPNEAGHLHMAGVLFKLMGADGLVSEVRIDAASGKVLAANKAQVRDLKATRSGLSFKRLDNSLPLPIDPIARPGLFVDVPTTIGTPRDLFGMSRYLLTVSGLAAGTYQLSIDGEAVAKVTAAQLAKGFDAGLLDKGPVWEQSNRVLEAVRASIVAAPVDKITPGLPPGPQVPRQLPEAQPIERLWTLKPAA